MLKTREPERFHVDAPTSQGTWSELTQEARAGRSKREFFRVETVEKELEREKAERELRSWGSRAQRALAPVTLPLTQSAWFQWTQAQLMRLGLLRAVTAVQNAPLVSPKTLAQTRQRQRLIWIMAVTLVFALVVGGVYAYSAASATKTSEIGGLSNSNATTGGLPASMDLHQLSYIPMQNLTMHIVTTYNPEPAISAQSAFVYDPNQGWVFYEMNPDQPQSIASLTKIMTGVIAYSSGSLDTPVTVGSDAAALVNSNNSYMGLSAGEQLTMRELVDGLLMSGANDAALAIADSVAGSPQAFVARMNAYAQGAGMRNTHFVSPDGASDGNISTARELALLSAIAIQQPSIASMTSTPQLLISQTSTHKQYKLTNTNLLLPGASFAYKGVNGLKTGYTPSAGYCIAVTAVQNGHLIVAILLGEPSEQTLYSDAHTVLDWGFAQES